VNISATSSISSYGYLSTSGTGTLASSGSIQVAIRCADRVLASEFDAYSDARKKTDIREVTEQEANAFLKIQPINYKMISSGEKSYGYLAQDVLKSCDHKKYQTDEIHLLGDLVSVVEEDGMEETIDEDGFINPANASFTINYSKCVPLLHKYIQMQDSIIKKNQEDIECLNTENELSKQKINQQELRLAQLELVITQLMSNK
jgi:hypothetical protein